MTKQLSVQLYTIRSALKSDLAGSLRRIAEIGFRNVELFAYVDRVDAYREALAGAELRAPSGHAQLIGQDIEPVLKASAALGIGTVIDPYVDEARWTTRSDILDIAREFASIADRAADQGLRVGYHNHAFELRNRIDGVSALEILADGLREDVVLELDTYWSEVGGEPAAALLQRLGDRVQFLHVKDGPVNHNNEQQTAVGKGRLDVLGITAAAPQAQQVIELDDHEGDVFLAVAESFDYLTRAAAAPMTWPAK